LLSYLAVPFVRRAAQSERARRRLLTLIRKGENTSSNPALAAAAMAIAWKFLDMTDLLFLLFIVLSRLDNRLSVLLGPIIQITRE
jgi:hypothetical protein